MGDEQDDGAAPGAVPDGPRDRLQVPPVHARTGLVVDDDARTRAPGGGDDEALLLPARQRQRMLLGVGQQVELVEQPVRLGVVQCASARSRLRGRQ